MTLYIANKNATVSCIYGTYNLVIGNSYPEFLYKKFPKHFNKLYVEESVVETPEETIEESIVEETNKKNERKNK